MFLYQDSAVENLLHSASPGSKSCLLFGYDFLSLGLQAVEDDAKQDFTGVADETDGSMVLTLPQVTLLWQWYDKGLSPFSRPLFLLPDLLAEGRKCVDDFLPSTFQQLSRYVVHAW